MPRAFPIVVLLAACAPPPPTAGPDLFRVAVSGVSGGSLLEVWGDASASTVYLVGGYVSVERTAITHGRVGRLARLAA